MAPAYAFKGSAQDKADTASLAVNSVDILANRQVCVGVIFFAAAGNPTVTWGNKTLRRDKTNEQTNPTDNFRVQLYRGRVRNNRTNNAVCTWGTSTPGARAMIVFETTEASHEDVSVVNDNNNSTTPNTSSAGTSIATETISIALFGSNGPSTDTQGTANLGHTLAERVGTSGGADTTNLTLQLTHEVLLAQGTVRSSLSGVTARDWANLIVAYSVTETFTVDSATYVPYDGHPAAEAVLFRIKDASGVVRFEVTIEREDFEGLTDAEVTAHLQEKCIWWAGKQIDGEISPDFSPDSAFDARIAGFENDTFEV